MRVLSDWIDLHWVTAERVLDRMRVCDHCGRAQFVHDAKGPRYQQCGRCRDVYYCGAACQRKAWPEHGRTCHL